VTHDELLARIDLSVEQINEEITAFNTVADWRVLKIFANAKASLLANRAVVELHKPCQIKNSMTYCEGCSNSAFFPWDSCPTIQAIEKELG